MNLEHIKIDNNHIELIYSLIICHKPKSLLEIGVGSGYTTRKIIQAFQYNNISTIENIDCVDNYYDWNGQKPSHLEFLDGLVTFIKSSEHDYVFNCSKKYDYIISDADHHNSDKWIDKTMDLLNPKGIIIYHDITNKNFPNLLKIVDYVETNNLKYFLFNKNSRPDERCDRGLLIISK